MDQNASFLDALGGRKFVLSILVIGVGTAVQMVGKNPINAEFAGLLVGILAAFNAANTYVTTQVQKTVSAAPGAPVDLTETHSKIDAISQQIAANSETVANMAMTAASTNKLIVAVAAQQKS